MGRGLPCGARICATSVRSVEDFWIANLQMAQAYEQLGEDALALEALSRGGGVGGENSKVLSLRGYVLAKMGRENEAREVIKTLEALALERYMPPYAIAQVHAGLREVDRAFAWLERGIEDHDVHLVMLPTEPKWDALRRDARFANLLRRCGLPYRRSELRVLADRDARLRKI